MGEGNVAACIVVDARGLSSFPISQSVGIVIKGPTSIVGSEYRSTVMFWHEYDVAVTHETAIAFKATCGSARHEMRGMRGMNRGTGSLRLLHS